MNVQPRLFLGTRSRTLAHGDIGIDGGWSTLAAGDGASSSPPPVWLGWCEGVGIGVVVPIGRFGGGVGLGGLLIAFRRLDG
jgi:hypothetical protein